MVRVVGEHRKPPAGARTTGFENIWTTSRQCLYKECSFPWQLAVWERKNAPPLDGCNRWSRAQVPSPSEIPPVPKHTEYTDQD